MMEDPMLRHRCWRWRGVALIPLGCVLGGCGFEPEYAWVEVHNHTDITVIARDADRYDYDSEWTVIPAHSKRTVGIDVDFYDADIEVDAGGARREYDLDFSPFEFREDLHVREADFSPASNG